MNRHRPRRPLGFADRRSRWHWSVGTLAAALTGAIAVAVLAGVWTSRIVTPGKDSQPPASRVVRAGPVRLLVPAEWTPAATSKVGIAKADPARVAVLTPSPGFPEWVVVTLGPADDPSLIPHDLRALLRDPPPRSRRISLGGRPAWFYPALTTRRPNLLMDVTVLPTTAGMLAVACASPAYAWAAALECAAAVESVSLSGAATLMPSPTVALAARLPALHARLDRARANGRAALSRADTRATQAAAARRLADQHRAAADTLDPALGAASRTLAARLDDSARAYAALASAARDGSAARFRSARREIRAADSDIASAINDTLQHGTQQTTPNTTPSPAGTP